MESFLVSVEDGQVFRVEAVLPGELPETAVHVPANLEAILTAIHKEVEIMIRVHREWVALYKV